MNPPRAAITALTLSTLAVGLNACGSADETSPAADTVSSTRLSLVASTNVWGDVASQVGGDLVDVTSVISDPNQDPHSFEADPGTLLDVSRAAVVITNGGGYDDFMAELVEASDSDALVLDAVAVSGRTAPDGEELNEHVWYDLPSVQSVARAVAEELSTADPDNATTYAGNAAAFEADLDDLIAEETDAAASTSGATVGVTEPVPLYLSEAMGLTNVTPEAFSEAVEEGDDVSVAVLKETLDAYAADEVDVLLYNEQTSGPITERIRDAAETAGVPVVSVTETLPEGEDFVSWMRGTIDDVAAAVAAR